MSSQSLIILSPTTPPATTARPQRHTPRPSNSYSDHRACLRWDSGFTCCFCLIHETDLDAHGVEGTGLTSIEHLQLQSTAPGRVTDYDNLAYACRYCNGRRSTHPRVSPSGARLLDPWQDAWGAHFRLRDDRLEPLYDDERGRDARYTEEVYRLNDPRKVTMRRERRELIEDRLRYVTEDFAAMLRDVARRVPDEAHSRRLFEQAREIDHQRERALCELRMQPAIPRDAPTRCRCGHQEHHTLPPQLPVREIPA